MEILFSWSWLGLFYTPINSLRCVYKRSHYGMIALPVISFSLWKIPYNNKDLQIISQVYITYWEAGWCSLWIQWYLVCLATISTRYQNCTCSHGIQLIQKLLMYQYGWKKKFINLSDFTTLQLFYESTLLATKYMEILCGLQYFTIRVAENPRLTCLSLLLASVMM